MASNNSTGAFEAASVPYPLPSYPVLSKRISGGGSWRKAAEGNSITEQMTNYLNSPYQTLPNRSESKKSARSAPIRTISKNKRRTRSI